MDRLLQLPTACSSTNSVEVTYTGPAKSQSQSKITVTAFSDMHRELYDIYVSGDVVVVELALQGTHDGRATSPLRHPAADGQPHGRALLRRVQARPTARSNVFDCYPSGTVILSQLGVLGNLDAVLQQHVTV